MGTTGNRLIGRTKAQSAAILLAELKKKEEYRDSVLKDHKVMIGISPLEVHSHRNLLLGKAAEIPTLPTDEGIRNRYGHNFEIRPYTRDAGAVLTPQNALVIMDGKELTGVKSISFNLAANDERTPTVVVEFYAESLNIKSVETLEESLQGL